MNKKIVIVHPHRDPILMEKEEFTYSDFRDILQDELCYETIGNFDLVCCDSGGEDNLLFTDEKMLTGPFIISRFDENTGNCLGVTNTDYPIIKNTIITAKEKEIPITFYEKTWTI